MREIDLGWLVMEQVDLSAGLFIALFEGLKLGYGRALEGKRSDDSGPIDLDRSATLLRNNLRQHSTGFQKA